MIYNKKLKVETDEENLLVQKKIIEEDGNAWVVLFYNGYVYNGGVGYNGHAVCVSRKHYRYFIVDSFGNLVFCEEDVYNKSHNEEISLKELEDTASCMEKE